jgi:hypothetical protein
MDDHFRIPALAPFLYPLILRFPKCMNAFVPLGWLSIGIYKTYKIL